MGLGVLSTVPLTPADFEAFSFSNMDEHVKAANAIFRLYGIAIPIHPLDPIDLTNMAEWLFNHQAQHYLISGALNISAANLAVVDFRNSEQTASWISLHFDEHLQWSDLLRLT